MGKFSFSVITEMERGLPFYLVGVGVDFHQEMDPHSRPKGYPHYQWIQCEEGEGLLNIEGREYVVGPNKAMFLYPKIPHHYYPVTNPWKVHWFTFNGRGLPQILQVIGLKESGVYSVVQGDQLVGRMRVAFHHLLSDSELKGLECSALVYDFLITLMKYIHRDDEEPVAIKYSRLKPVFDFISKNYHNIITIDDLAATMEISAQHLCHLFKETMNHRPFEYVNTYRIARSKDLMMEKPELNLGEVARNCGYGSLNYFSSVFRKVEGMSPGEYRRLYGGAG
jgi:AraC-like DNA-binding protein/quercetin dioxygenase-like cupin family protein